MPNSVLGNLFSCFGLNQSATEVRAPHAHRTDYTPGHHYSVAELNQFALNNLPNVRNRPYFLSDLRNVILSPGTSKSDKAMLCKQLALLMTDQDSLECQGAPRQANYFASYCIDLTLQDLEHQYYAAMEHNLRSMLTLWMTTLCPSQTDFNLNGVIYSRSELNNMLQNPSLISRQLQQAPTALAHQWERRLYGEGTSSNAQTVHDSAVRDNGSRVLNIMRVKHGQTKPLSNDEASRFIHKAAVKHESQSSILAGMNKCLMNTSRDNNWNVNISPQNTLKQVIQYIQSNSNSTMRTNLTNSLLERLREIHLEDPCVSGVLQRLIDVPNGIDPDMNFGGAYRQVGEEMATLASKTYEQFSDLIDEGIEAITEQEGASKIARTVASDIGQQMFETRVHQDMTLLGGLDNATLAPHREHLKTGFTLLS